MTKPFVPAFLFVVVLVYACLTFSSCQINGSIREVFYEKDTKILTIAETSGFDPDEALVQIIRSEKALIFCDFLHVRKHGENFEFPPPEIEKLAQTLEPEHYQQVGKWLVLGINPKKHNDHFSFWYKGALVVVDGDKIATGKLSKRAASKSIPDFISLQPGEVVFLDASGYLLSFQNLDDLQEIYRSHQEKLHYRVVPGHNPIVRFHTTKGDFLVELLEDQAPQAVAAFLSLLEQGYWERDCIFYRVCPFSKANGGENLKLAQFGNPDQSNHSFVKKLNDASEPTPGLPHRRGTLAMLTEENAILPGHAFLNLVDGEIPSWQNKYPIFGKVLEPEAKIDPQALLAGKTQYSQDIFKTVLEKLRPGDKLLKIEQIRQQRTHYSFPQSKPIPSQDS